MEDELLRRINQYVKTEQIVEEIVDKWDRLGLLNGLDEKLKKICALKYEEVTLYVCSPDYLDDGEEDAYGFETLVLPVIRRLLTSEDVTKSFKVKLITPGELRESFINFFKYDVDKIELNVNADREAELLLYFIKQF